MLIVPHLCQNWPRYVLIYLGHICWNICGPHLITPWLAFVDCATFLPKVDHICLALFGPYLLFNKWATLGSHSDTTFPWTLPTQAHMWFDTFGPFLLFYMWATSGLHPFWMSHKKASSASGPHPHAIWDITHMKSPRSRSRQVYLKVEQHAHWLLMWKETNQLRHVSNDLIISDWVRTYWPASFRVLQQNFALK